MVQTGPSGASRSTATATLSRSTSPASRRVRAVPMPGRSAASTGEAPPTGPRLRGGRAAPPPTEADPGPQVRRRKTRHPGGPGPPARRAGAQRRGQPARVRSRARARSGSPPSPRRRAWASPGRASAPMRSTREAYQKREDSPRSIEGRAAGEHPGPALVPLPAHLHDRAAGALVVFHLDVVSSRRHGPRRPVGGGAVIGPPVDHEHVVHPEPDAVIADGREGPRSRGEVEPAGPPDREVVVGNAVPGPPVPQLLLIAVSQRVKSGVPVSVRFAKYSARYSPTAQEKLAV